MRKYLKKTKLYDTIYSALHGEIEANDAMSRWNNKDMLEITPLQNEVIGEDIN